MGIQALYRKPNTSRKHPAHPVFPYALRGLAIEQANQVWALDITYIPMARGWVYLVAVLDWHSRRVLAHRVSITMEVDFCVEALREAAARWGAPEIVNTDQGSQFSSAEFVAEVARIGARQSMDGKGCWRDKDYVSYCTSFARSKRSLPSRHRSDSLVPGALRGASSPGGSYKHSFLSL
jgi:putative transposase